jgi:hypothetical protein
MVSPLRIFIGWDSREPLAFQVFAHSLLRRASGPLSIIPLVRGHVSEVYTRPPNGTTEFSLTRFLVPYLSNYEGFSVFADCDMLALSDIYQVFSEVAQEPGKAVYVCQHDYVPKDAPKATGVQTSYPRKNWSSFMVFDNARCRALTPDYVNTASPSDLHRLKWLVDVRPDEADYLDGARPGWRDEAIGALPLSWNWLVGEYDPNPRADILHFTLGTPCFREYRDCDHADLWLAEHESMSAPMGEYSPLPAYAVARAAGYPVPPRSA